MAKKARMGRPPLFRKREVLTVCLDANELAAIERLARSADVSVSSFTRSVLLKALRLGRTERAREV
jgi:hypothetical protein